MSEPPDFPDWPSRLEDLLARLGDGDRERGSFLTANGDAIARALTGVPVDGGPRRPGVGGCVVVNMSSAWAPDFTRAGARYKNCYDLDDDRRRVGEAPRTSAKRTAVDAALAPLHGAEARGVYFAAVEFNGCGIGFYGDLCLVLRDDITESEAVILDRNSYDLIREPLRSEIAEAAQRRQTTLDQAREDEAREHAGVLSEDLPALAAIKVLESRQPVLRLVSTGAVSEGVLDDEDYIEVLRTRTFEIGDVLEVRLSPADVTLDERIRGRSLTGRPPSQAENLWRQQRREAEERLSAIGVPVRVVTTVGRTKG